MPGLGVVSVVGGRFGLTSAQLPTCGRLHFSLHIFFFSDQIKSNEFTIVQLKYYPYAMHPLDVAVVTTLNCMDE